MVLCRSPPGLSNFQPVTLATKVAVEALSGEMRQQFNMLLDRFNLIINLLQDDLGVRVSRLESLVLCCSSLSPSVDEVLNKMLAQKSGNVQSAVELSS